MQEPVEAAKMQQPIKVDNKNRKIPVSFELADSCFTCGACASGCPATGLVPGWESQESHTGYRSGVGTGGHRFQVATGLYPVRSVPVHVPSRHPAFEDVPKSIPVRGSTYLLMLRRDLFQKLTRVQMLAQKAVNR
jgi:ferredoxin